jgi:FdhE protein
MAIKPVTRDMWLSTHAYLQPVAQLQALVDAAFAGIRNEKPDIPVWNDYAADFQKGVPLLQSTAVIIDLAAPARAVVSLIQKVASVQMPDKLAEQTRTLDSELRSNPVTPLRAIAWLLDRDGYSSDSPGLLRYLGWTSLAGHFRPVVQAFGAWRDEEQWLRNYCPTCGSPPSMGQLVGTDPGRLRLLSCGRCKTRWRYKRTGCPFCENQNDHRLAVLAVEGQGGLRIDHCESCGGFLKTYDGEGSENVLLADWTSIHLDIIAHDRGLIRSAASLYEVS